jgi:hypothetical protein
VSHKLNFHSMKRESGDFHESVILCLFFNEKTDFCFSCAVVSHYSVFRLGTSGFCSAGLSTRACALLCLISLAPFDSDARLISFS